MKVDKIMEHTDGSATVYLDMSDEELRTLVEYAVVDILRKQLELPNDKG